MQSEGAESSRRSIHGAVEQEYSSGAICRVNERGENSSNRSWEDGGDEEEERKGGRQKFVMI